MYFYFIAYLGLANMDRRYTLALIPLPPSPSWRRGQGRMRALAIIEGGVFKWLLKPVETPKCHKNKPVITSSKGRYKRKRAAPVRGNA